MCGRPGKPLSELSVLRVCETGHAPVALSWTWESVAEYEAWYADPTAYHVDEQIENGQPSCMARVFDSLDAAEERLQLLACYKPQRGLVKLLDVGAGNGAFVYAAKKAGYIADGVDPNPLAPFIYKGYWSSVTDWYGVITLHDVIEHLPDPRACLLHLQQNLAKGGVVVIQTPEWDGPDQRRAGELWRHIRPRQHLCLYSRGAAEQLYAECGLEVIGFHRPKRGAIGQMVHYVQKAGTV